MEHGALYGLLGNCLHPETILQFDGKLSFQQCATRLFTFSHVFPPHLTLGWLPLSRPSPELVRGRNYLKDGKHTISYYSHRINKCKRKRVNSVANSIFDKMIGNLFT